MKYALLYKNGSTSIQYNKRKDVEGVIERLCINSLSHHVVGILVIKLKKTAHENY